MSASHFYQKECYCPVCLTIFKTTALRQSSAYVQTVESDFHVIYSNQSPMHYTVTVCPVCNFSAPNMVFKTELPPKIAELLPRALLSMYPEKVNLCGERTLADALKSWQMAIQSGQLRKASSGEMAGIFLSAAWMSRELGNRDLEGRYLVQALTKYIEAYDKETMPIGKLDALGVMYLIGELNRRTGNPKDAISWFNRLINDRSIKKNPRLEKMTREQWQQASHDFKSSNMADNEAEDMDYLHETLQSAKQDPPVAAPKPKPISPQKIRRTMHVPVNLYNDQIEWLNKVVNLGYDKTKRLVTKEQVVRALLDAAIDALKEKDIVEPFGTEEELVEIIKKLIKE